MIISGIDDAGNASPGTNLTFNLAGGIGDRKGKWRLTVTSDEPDTVQSLLGTPAGFITNLSTSA